MGFIGLIDKNQHNIIYQQIYLIFNPGFDGRPVGSTILYRLFGVIIFCDWTKGYSCGDDFLGFGVSGIGGLLDSCRIANNWFLSN